MKTPIYLTVLLSLFWGIVFAQIPHTLSVQGVLTDIEGNSLTDDSYDLTFRLYHSATDEAIQWQEALDDVQVGAGVFSVILGKVNALNIPFDRPYYLGISVENGDELFPRIELTAVPYSMQAMSVAEGAINENSIAENSITHEKILTNIISGINGVSNDGGEITLEAGDNITIMPNPEDNSIIISSIGTAAGDIMSVNAGDGLSGGGTSGEITLSIDRDQLNIEYVNENQINGVSRSMIQSDAVSTDKISPDIISSINNLTNDGGNIDLVEGDNINITQNDATKSIIISSIAIRSIQGGNSILVTNENGPVTSVSILSNSIDDDEIRDYSLTELSLAANSVGADEIKDNAVGSAELQSNAVTQSKLALSSVGSPELQDNSVGQAEIQTNAVGSAEIQTDAVTQSELAPNSVGSIELQDNSVGQSEIQSNAIGQSEIQTNAVGSAEIQTDAVTQSELAPNAVGSIELQGNSVGQAEIRSNAVGTREIQQNAVTLDKILPNIISSIDGLTSDGGNINFLAGDNMTIVSDNVTKTITFSADGGNDIIGPEVYLEPNGFLGALDNADRLMAGIGRNPDLGGGIVGISNSVGLQIAALAADNRGAFLEMRNNLGNTVSLLSTSEFGGGLFELGNASNNLVVRLGADPQGNGVIGVGNLNDQPMALMEVNEENGGEFGVFNADDRGVARLSTLDGHGTLEIYNNRGNILAGLSANQGGGSLFGLGNELDNQVISMGSNSSSLGYIDILNINGDRRATMTMNSDDHGEFFVTNSQNNIVSVLTEIGDFGFIGVSRPNGFNIAAMTHVPSSVEGFIYTTNADGALVSQMASDGNSNGYIGVQNSFEAPIVSMHGTAEGNGYFDIFNNEGKRIGDIGINQDMDGGLMKLYNSSESPVVSVLSYKNDGRLKLFANGQSTPSTEIIASDMGGLVEISNNVGLPVAALGSAYGVGFMGLANANDEVVLEAASNERGGGFLGLYNESGTGVVKIESDENGHGNISVGDNNFIQQASIGVNQLNEGIVSVFNSQGFEASVLTQFDDYGFIGVSKPSGFNMAAMTHVPFSDAGYIYTTNSDGIEISQMAADGFNNGYIGVQNSVGAPIVAMYGNESGHGYLDVLNNLNSPLVTLSKDQDRDGGRVTIYNEVNANIIGYLGTNFQNKGRLQINNDVGLEQAVVTALTDGGYIAVDNNSGEDVARIAVNTSGAGIVVVDNINGDRAVQLNSLSSGDGYIGVNSNGNEVVEIMGNDNVGEVNILSSTGIELATMSTAVNPVSGYLGINSSNGTNVARMTTQIGGGNGYIGTYTSSGAELASISSASNNGTISTFDIGGHRLVGLSSTTTGNGWLEINNSSGNSRVIATANTNGGGYLGLNNNAGQERSRATTLSNGAGGFYTWGNNGQLNTSMATSFSSYANHGCVRVYNSSGDDRAGMCINEYGEGQSWADIKHFKMNHPKDATKEIWYASLEGPEAGAYFRGTARLTNGEVTIPLPDHFSEVADSKGMTVQLTPLSAYSEGLAVIKKSTHEIVVKELRNGKGNYEFDYIIHAIRKGYEDYDVIRPKKEIPVEKIDADRPTKQIGLDESAARTKSNRELVIPVNANIDNR